MFYKRFPAKVVLVAIFSILVACTPKPFTVMTPFTNLPEGIKCTGIYPFKNLSNTSKAGLVVAQVFYDEIYGRKGWKAINWDTLLRIAESTKNKLPPDPTNSQLARFGKNIGLGSIIYGSVIDLRYRISGSGIVVPVVSFSTKIIDTETGRIIWTGMSSAIGSIGEDTVTSLLRRIIDGMILDITRRTKSISPATCNPQSKILKLFSHLTAEAIGKKPKTPSLSLQEAQIYNLIMNKKRFILEGVRFRGKTLTLQPKAYQIISYLGKVMEAYPTIKIKIECHTDPSGDPMADKKLTTDQAKLIFQYLISHFKISPNRIEYAGIGSDRPLLPNISRRNRELNRRVEIVVLEK